MLHKQRAPGRTPCFRNSAPGCVASRTGAGTGSCLFNQYDSKGGVNHNACYQYNFVALRWHACHILAW